MKEFIISSSDLDTALDKLYTFCMNHNCNFAVTPTTKTIEVFKINSETSYTLVAAIHIAEVVEPYELVRDLINNI